MNFRQSQFKWKINALVLWEEFWKDGAYSDNNSVRRKIVYIPQTYLNKLSDEEQGTTKIDDIIRDIILQDDSCNVAYNQMNSKIVILKQNITKTIFDFL